VEFHVGPPPSCVLVTDRMYCFLAHCISAVVRHRVLLNDDAHINSNGGSRGNHRVPVN